MDLEVLSGKAYIFHIVDILVDRRAVKQIPQMIDWHFSILFFTQQ